jgi:iduronate 2-sulfatase
LDNPDVKGKQYAVSQFPNPALREWAANPLSPGMRKTFFGPLIEEVENRIKKQQGKRWDRELFENHLMGYTIRSDRYRMVAWLDYRDVEAEPFYVELYDHRKDPTETQNIAHKLPSKAQELLKKLRDSGIGERE